MAIWQWSKTPLNNATADPTISLPEGMPPSAVNDDCRAMMARIAEWRDDSAGMLADTGTSTAYAVTTNEGVQTPTPADQTKISFYPANTNGPNVTLAADAGSPFPIQSPIGTAIPSGTMVAATPYDVVFHAATNVWVLKNIFATAASPAIVPLGGLIDFAGSTVPNSNFAFPFGQAISQSTYSALFALLSFTYGNPGGGNFNLPDLRGRAAYGVDNMGGSTAGRINVAGGNFDGTVLGGTGGAQNHTLITGEIPVHSHTITDPGHTHTIGLGSGDGYFTGSGHGFSGGGSGNTGSNTTGITGTNNAGSGNLHTILNPAIMLNKLIRIL